VCLYYRVPDGDMTDEPGALRPDDPGDALRIAAAAGTLGAPVSHSDLVRMVLETAAHVISARGGALLLLDEEGDELVFEVSVGSEAGELAGLRVPLGHGIAGLVAATGQPMAVSDADDDPRVSSDVAQRIDYTPESLLCVPLFYGDQVIGVLELVDKEGAPAFSGRDMEALALFARQAAVAIRQSRTHQNVAQLVRQALASPDDSQAQSERGEALAAGMEHDAVYRRALALAELVNEIASRGEAELRACQEMLRAFAEYLRTRPRAADEETAP
jgi:GAF domain-containing protein